MNNLFPKQRFYVEIKDDFNIRLESFDKFIDDGHRELDENSKEDLWVSLKFNPERYDLNLKFPYLIRDKVDNQIIEPSYPTNKNSYPSIKLYNRVGIKTSMQFHVLICDERVENKYPMTNIFVDHGDGDHRNFHISNLTHVSPSENSMNMHLEDSKTYKEIPEESLEILLCKDRELSNTFFYDNKFYQHNGLLYRQIPIKKDKFGKVDKTYIKLADSFDKPFKIYIDIDNVKIVDGELLEFVEEIIPKKKVEITKKYTYKTAGGKEKTVTSKYEREEDNKNDKRKSECINKFIEDNKEDCKTLPYNKFYEIYLEKKYYKVSYNYLYKCIKEYRYK
jgi:hypothetical protein